MKILITQANRSDDISILRDQMNSLNFDLAVFPEGYLSNEDLLNEATILAKQVGRPILSSYLNDSNKKDMAVVIDEDGEKVLQRKKSKIKGPLLSPSKAVVNNLEVGYMLCCEIFLDNIDFTGVDIIFNPIGVGMYSEEQFVEWSERARELALKFKCFVIGASHADGSYENCGTSIPVAYVYDRKGSQVYLSKNDTRSIIIDLESSLIQYQ